MDTGSAGERRIQCPSRRFSHRLCVLRVFVLIRNLPRFFSIGVLASLLAAGCARSSDPRVEVRYWTGWTGPALAAQKQLVARFNQEHPRLHVRVVSVAGSYNKVR